MAALAEDEYRRAGARDRSRSAARAIRSSSAPEADDGRPVAEFVLGHGADPVRELARLGWSRPAPARRRPGCRRRPRPHLHRDGGLGGDCRADAGAHRPGAGARAGGGGQPLPAHRGIRGRHERPRACCSPSCPRSPPHRAGGPCPAAGSTPVRQPVAALHREVWEESGQEVEARAAARGAHLALDRAGAQRSPRGLPRRADRVCRVVPPADRPRRPRRGRVDRGGAVGAARGAGPLPPEPVVRAAHAALAAA